MTETIMKIETTPFDAAKYLTAEEDRADLLAQAQMTGDHRFIDAALRVIERSRTMDHATFSSTIDDEESK
jgi:DNA-binding phage protein